MSGRRPEGHEPDTEEATEAIIEGDVGFRRGTAQAALRNRDFRIFWGGTFASNIGTWMQNVILSAYGSELTHSASFRVLFCSAAGAWLAATRPAMAAAAAKPRIRLARIKGISLSPPFSEPRTYTEFDGRETPIFDAGGAPPWRNSATKGPSTSRGRAPGASSTSRP